MTSRPYQISSKSAQRFSTWTMRAERHRHYISCTECKERVKKRNSVQCNNEWAKWSVCILHRTSRWNNTSSFTRRMFLIHPCRHYYNVMIKYGRALCVYVLPWANPEKTTRFKCYLNKKYENIIMCTLNTVANMQRIRYSSCNPHCRPPVTIQSPLHTRCLGWLNIVQLTQFICPPAASVVSATELAVSIDIVTFGFKWANSWHFYKHVLC
jgi:hypothetical protein